MHALGSHDPLGEGHPDRDEEAHDHRRRVRLGHAVGDAEVRVRDAHAERDAEDGAEHRGRGTGQHAEVGHAQRPAGRLRERPDSDDGDHRQHDRAERGSHVARDREEADVVGKCDQRRETGRPADEPGALRLRRAEEREARGEHRHRDPAPRADVEVSQQRLAVEGGEIQAVQDPDNDRIDEPHHRSGEDEPDLPVERHRIAAGPRATSHPPCATPDTRL
ncbi:MAG: hypothetical protein FJZ92_08400 [Chloroflexi bacterium]|nr:hypothetical protein [Chloroflexota bacterium]